MKPEIEGDEGNNGQGEQQLLRAIVATVKKAMMGVTGNRVTGGGCVKREA
jgi:hypothetical protein